jgi:folate-binding Fe-S cluster repair protein YgfZ
LEARAISYEKGCDIGQETIARIKTYGHLNRQLIQCEAQGTCLPKRGEKILVERRTVGWVSSPVNSARLGKLQALGYVQREFVKTRTQLKINQQTAEVIKRCGE